MRARIVLVAVAVFMSTLASAQFGRDPPEISTEPPEAEFHMARLAYYARGCAGSRGWCNPWWAIDYPHAEAHFLPAVERMTSVEVAPDSRSVTLADDTVFEYPWLFLQQPGQGNWFPQGDELLRLREYLERGGFLVVDDFHGEGECPTATCCTAFCSISTSARRFPVSVISAGNACKGPRIGAASTTTTAGSWLP
jgi:hypothetical protein